MAKKKKPSTFLEKLSEKASHVKEDLVAGKDHLMEVAGDAVASVKHSIEEFKAKKAATKKAVVKKAAPVKKKVAKKAAVVKKAVSAKSKTAVKTVKKAAKKTAKKVAAKKSPAKKK